MLRIVSNETKLQSSKKWIFCWGLLTLALSTQTPPEDSDISGSARTIRLSLLWLVAVTGTLSTVQHRELGIELRVGPMAMYLALEDYPMMLVR